MTSYESSSGSPAAHSSGQAESGDREQADEGTDAFEPGRIDQEVTVGEVEEWTILNASPMDHPFHLHVWPMQVLDVGGRTVDAVTYRDVVNVPARSQTTVRIAFDRYPGPAVYHCHILDHEDLGMMGTVRATK